MSLEKNLIFTYFKEDLCCPGVVPQLEEWQGAERETCIVSSLHQYPLEFL